MSRLRGRLGPKELLLTITLTSLTVLFESGKNDSRKPAGPGYKSVA